MDVVTEVCASSQARKTPVPNLSPWASHYFPNSNTGDSLMLTFQYKSVDKYILNPILMHSSKNCKGFRHYCTWTYPEMSSVEDGKTFLCKNICCVISNFRPKIKPYIKVKTKKTLVSKCLNIR